jgi:hypothetical protein
MKFELELTETAQNDIKRHIKSGDKKLLKKLDSLFYRTKKSSRNWHWKTRNPETLRCENLFTKSF